MSTTEKMEVGNSPSVPRLQIGGPGYGIMPTIPKPCMAIKPELAHLIGRRPGGGQFSGAGAGSGRAPPTFLPFMSQASSSTSTGVSARRVQEAVVSNRLAQAVGELATIQIRDALEKAFFPGIGIGQNQKRKAYLGMTGDSLRARLGLQLGKIVKTGGGGRGGIRGKSLARSGGGISRGHQKAGSTGGGECRSRKPSETRQWGKWGKDANKDVLDAELDQYVAQRDKNSAASLDAELDRYHARAAAARKMTGPGESSNVSKISGVEKMEPVSDCVVENGARSSGETSASSTQEESHGNYRNPSTLVMNTTEEKDKDFGMNDETDDYDEDALEIDEDALEIDQEDVDYDGI